MGEKLTQDEVAKKFEDYKRTSRNCLYSLVGGALIFISPLFNSVPEEYTKLKKAKEVHSQIVEEGKFIKLNLERISLSNSKFTKKSKNITKLEEQVNISYSQLSEMFQQEVDSIYNANREIISEYELRENKELSLMIIGGIFAIFSELGLAYAINRKDKYKRMLDKNSI